MTVQDSDFVELLEGLQNLASPEFRERHALFQIQNASILFSQNSSVKDLIRVFSNLDLASVKAVVEKHLDSWFETLREGEYFEYTETVMALLFVLSQSTPDLGRTIATTFAESKAAEIGTLSHYAQHLLKENS